MLNVCTGCIRIQTVKRFKPIRRSLFQLETTSDAFVHNADWRICLFEVPASSRDKVCVLNRCFCRCVMVISGAGLVECCIPAHMFFSLAFDNDEKLYYVKPPLLVTMPQLNSSVLKTISLQSDFEKPLTSEQVTAECVKIT